jgi:general secretion pathway protein C
MLAALCAVYWALKFASGPVAPASAAVAAPSSVGAVDPLALAKGLGGGSKPLVASSPVEAVAVPSLQASRFVLTGVVVQKAGSGQGVALIAVDGKPPRPYRVNATLADGVILHSVSAGKAMLATSKDAAPSLNLELPQLTSAVAGNVVAVRPAMPAPVIAASPAPMVPPVAAATPQAPSLATPPANPMAGLGIPGQRPPRPGANRQQAEKDAARDQ